MGNDSEGKKGFHPLAWVGLGCGAMLIIGILGGALLIGWCQRAVEAHSGELSDPESAAAMVAEMAIRSNPDLELVSSDRESGTVTFRDKDSGTETTVTYDDALEGKFTVRTDDGVTVIDGSNGGIRTETPSGVATFGRGGIENLPDWFEVPEGVTKWQSIMHQETGGKVSGMLRGETGEKLAVVIDAFIAHLETAGFKQASRADLGATITIVYRMEAEVPRTITVQATSQGGKRFVQLEYDQ
jgi:hypothetical protein